jgi:hypothetical protein
MLDAISVPHACAHEYHEACNGFRDPLRLVPTAADGKAAERGAFVLSFPEEDDQRVQLAAPFARLDAFLAVYRNSKLTRESFSAQFSAAFPLTGLVTTEVDVKQSSGETKKVLASPFTSLIHGTLVPRMLL